MNEIKIKEDFARKSSLGKGGKKEGSPGSGVDVTGKPVSDWADVKLEGFDNGLTESRTFKRNKG